MSHEELNTDHDRQFRYFQFDLATFNNDFAATVEYWLECGTDELQSHLIEKFPSNQKAIKLQIGLLRDLYQIEAKDLLKKFKDTSKEIFRLPTNVLLPDFIEGSAVSESEVEQLSEEVNNLEQKYIEEAYFNAELKHEAAKFEQVASVQETCETILTKLKRKNNNDDKPISELVKSAKICNEFVIANSTKDSVIHSNLFNRQ